MLFQDPFTTARYAELNDLASAAFTAATPVPYRDARRDQCPRREIADKIVLVEAVPLQALHLWLNLLLLEEIAYIDFARVIVFVVRDVLMSAPAGIGKPLRICQSSLCARGGEGNA